MTCQHPLTVDASRPLVHQHRPRLYDDGQTLLVFDNGESTSRVVEFVVDEAAGTATELRAVDPGLWAYSLGDVERISSGELVIDWGTAGVVSAVTPEGDTRWQLSGSLGNGFGFGQVLPFDGLE